VRTSLLICFATFFIAACEPGKPVSETTDPNTAVDAEQTSTLIDYSAHWLSPDVLLISKAEGAKDIRLHYSLDAAIKFDEDNINLGESPSFLLKETGGEISPKSKEAGYTPVQPEIPVKEGALKLLLKGQMVVVQKDSQNNIIKLSQVHRAKLIDHLYTSNEDDANEVDDFGATIGSDGVQFKVWAPTARSVEVLLFNQDKTPLSPAALDMQVDGKSGVWSAKGDVSLNRAYYKYRVKVYHPATKAIETIVTTDPYSLSLSTNSQYSQVVDLDAKDTKPAGWDEQEVLALDNYEDSILYELHIRDFSALDKGIAKPERRGKYAAFNETQSDGIKHLKALKQAGLTHIHLLPTFDIATINEDPTQAIYPGDTMQKICSLVPDNALCKEKFDPSQTLQDLLESYDTQTGDAQKAIESIRHLDAYNWGYDPYHYTVPEGVYAQNPEGVSRIVEFRTMIKAIHDMGFRVAMDVVYNHTHSNETVHGRLHDYAVLGKIVPDYYNRLNPSTGQIERSTCCENTATEHVMMGKLMVDSLAVWAKHYKIDSFRFDLMGHQPKALMLEAYDAIKAIDPDNYFYGEGWNFGEVANNSLFVQATQLELAGTEIGTYTDRMRDAVRGQGFVSGDAIRSSQGIGNGLYLAPNERQPDDKNKALYQLYMDQLRVGLAANLANFPLENAAGENVQGKDIPYGGNPTGYALDPADTISYVSKHDNQTLWDINQYRVPYDMSTDDRVRLQMVGLAYPMLAQGVPFIHMGSEILRSKAFLEDSYDFGDWFNGVDFSMQTTRYNKGLPPAIKDQENWDIIGEVIEKNQGRDIPTPEHKAYAMQVFMEWLKIRSGSPLFRLTNEQDIIERVSFHNTGKTQVDGVIAMQINDEKLAQDLDKNYDSIVVMFNNSPSAQTLAFEGAAQYRLHPVQTRGVDELLKTSANASDSGFTVPKFSTAIFVK